MVKTGGDICHEPYDRFSVLGSTKEVVLDRWPQHVQFFGKRPLMPDLHNESSG